MEDEAEGCESTQTNSKKVLAFFGDAPGAQVEDSGKSKNLTQFFGSPAPAVHGSKKVLAFFGDQDFSSKPAKQKKSFKVLEKLVPSPPKGLRDSHGQKEPQDGPSGGDDDHMSKRTISPRRETKEIRTSRLPRVKSDELANQPPFGRKTPESPEVERDIPLEGVASRPSVHEGSGTHSLNKAALMLGTTADDLRISDARSAKAAMILGASSPPRLSKSPEKSKARPSYNRVKSQEKIRSSNPKKNGSSVVERKPSRPRSAFGRRNSVSDLRQKQQEEDDLDRRILLFQDGLDLHAVLGNMLLMKILLDLAVERQWTEYVALYIGIHNFKKLVRLDPSSVVKECERVFEHFFSSTEEEATTRALRKSSIRSAVPDFSVISLSHYIRLKNAVTSRVDVGIHMFDELEELLESGILKPLLFELKESPQLRQAFQMPSFMEEFLRSEVNMSKEGQQNPRIRPLPSDSAEGVDLILGDRVWLKRFQSFLFQQHAVEGLLFIQEVAQFKMLFLQDEVQDVTQSSQEVPADNLVIRVARDIYYKYFGEDAPFELNVDAKLARSIADHVQPVLSKPADGVVRLAIPVCSLYDGAHTFCRRDLFTLYPDFLASPFATNPESG